MATRYALKIDGGNPYPGADSYGAAIAEQLREDIVARRLLPGTRLSQEGVSERFGVSRMPARDALRQLVQEGLVVALGIRRFVVAELSDEDVEDMWTVEAILFGYSARRATVNASEDDLEQLEATQRSMREAVEADRLDDAIDCNRRFHQGIHALANSAKLDSLFPLVHTPMPRSYLRESYRDFKTLVAEHDGIIAAMRARDSGRAERLMIAHIQAGATALVRWLADQRRPG